MKFIFDKEKLIELMRDFYILTNIRIVVFDSELNKIASYPEQECELCNKIKATQQGRELCFKSDNEACRICTLKNALHIYKCHAGLIEAVSPLKMNDIILGYIMLGQIADKKDKKIKKDEITEYISNYTKSKTEAEELFSTLVSKSDSQIKAAAKIMETCACYLWVSRLVKLDEDSLVFRIDSYINDNITENLSADIVCEKFKISRNKLYKISNDIYGMGIAQYIRKKRVNIAKSYLKHGYSVAESAEMAGFHDYNYFSKIFKRETGEVPSRQR